MLTYIWLIPLLPFLGFVVNGFGGLLKLRLTGTRLSKPFVYWVGCGSVFLAFLLSVGCFIELLRRDAHHRIVEVTVFEWIPGLAFQTVTAGLVKLTVSWGMQLDPLSAVMILVVTGVGFLIHVYSIGYMYEESGLLPVLCLPEPVHVHDADPGPREQLPADVRRLGGRGPLLLSPDRLLHRKEERRRCRQEGLRRQPDR